MESELLSLIGIDVTSLITISGMVYLIMELAKGKIPKGLLFGWRTDVMAFGIAFGLSYKILYPDWSTALMTAFACWLLPAGFHKVRKNGKNDHRG